MKYNFKKIVERLEFLKKRDYKIDKHLNGFCKAINPANYPIFFEHSCVTGFLEGIKVINKEIAEELIYYLYETTCEITTKDGTVYNIKNKKDLIKYLEITYNN